MKEKEKDMDRLNSKWEEGVSLGIENPDIERRIAKLNSDWDELCDLTEAKSNTANTALQNMEDYDVSLSGSGACVSYFRAAAVPPHPLSGAAVSPLVLA